MTDKINTPGAFREAMEQRFAPTGPAAPVAKAPPPLPPKKSPPPLPPKAAAAMGRILQDDLGEPSAADRLRAIAASLPAYQHSTELPTPESGFVNPPSDPPVQLAATPEELAAIQGIEPVAPPEPKLLPQPVTDELDGMTRAQLLEVGLAIGAFDAGTKLRETGLKAKIRAKRSEFESRTDLNGPINEMALPLLTNTEVVTMSVQDAAELRDSLQKMNEAHQPKLIDTLYIGCRPDHGDVVSYTTLLVEANKLIERESGAVDYRRIPNSFGAGPAYLGAAVKSYLEADDDGADVGVDVYVDVRTPEGSAMLAVLESLASNIVRGGF